MTLPNGLDGISSAIGELFAVTGDPSILSGATPNWGLSSIPNMVNLTQDNVTAILKDALILGSVAWNDATNALFAFLRRGDPFTGAVSFSLALTEAIVQRLFGISVDFTDLGAALDAIEPVAILIDFLELIDKIVQGLGLLGTGHSIADVATAFAHAFEGFDMSITSPLLTVIDDAGTAIIHDIVDAIFPGGDGTATALSNYFVDLVGLLGSPFGLGSGSPVVPGIASIPLLGGLLSGGTHILDTLIPGLDASKIVSGTFASPLVQPFLDAVSVGFGGSTGLGFSGLQTFLSGLVFGIGYDDLIALFPGLTGGLTGSTGLGAIFTDLTGLLGSPTAVGSGSPVLPGIGSIPLLGGLLSGGNILTSIIPGLDASKIISGVFSNAMSPGLLPINIFNAKANSTNIVIDPTFEDTTVARSAGTSPDIGSTTVYSTDQAHSGFHSMMMTMSSGSGGSDAWMYLMPHTTFVDESMPSLGIKVKAGQTFYMEIWVYPKSTNSGTDATNLQIDAVDSTGVNPYTTVVAQGGNLSLPLGTWSKLSGYVTIPAGYDIMWPYCEAYRGSASSNVYYWDDAVIHDETQSQGIIQQLFGGTSVLSTVLSTVIPGLDVSKIVTGVFGSGFIPGLDASKIISGVLSGSLIPNLAASIITSGTFVSGLIPGLDASKIITGVLGTGQIPSITSAMASPLVSDVVGAITGTAGPLSGLTTWASGVLTSGGALDITNTTVVNALTGTGWFTDLKSLIGNPTGMGSGSPTLPGISSIPVLGGLLSGGNILSSIIPGLDTSKIVSGTFANSFSPGLLPQTLWQLTQVGAKNLVIGPDFEDTTITRDTTFGAGGSMAYSTDVARSGTHSYKVITSTATGGSQSDAFMLSSNTLGGGWSLTPASAIKTQAGQWFYTEVYVRGKSTNTATAGSLGVAAYVSDSTGVNTLFVAWLTNTPSMNGLSSSAWTKCSGWYQIPAGYDQIRLFAWTVNCNVANQTFYFDDAMIKEETHAQETLDTLVQAWGGTGVGHLLGDLTTYATAIPNQFVQGLLGNTQIGGTVQNFVDSGIQAINNSLATGGSFGIFQTALNAVTNLLGYTTSGPSPTGSVNQVATANSQWVANTAVMKPVTPNLDVTMDSTFLLSDLNTWGGTLNTIASLANQGQATVGFISTPNGGQKQSVGWLGYFTGGTSSGAFFVAVYRYNTTTTAWDQVYASSDIHASVGTGTNPVWNYLNLPSISFINSKQGDIYAAAFWTFDTTYNFVGAQDTAPGHPTAQPALRGAKINAIQPILGYTSTGAGHSGWGTLNEPLTLDGSVSYIIVPVIINYTVASPPTTFNVSTTVSGTVHNFTQIGSYPFLSSGGQTWAIYWWALQITPGSLGTSCTVQITASGGTGGSFDAVATAWYYVTGVSIVNNALGASTTIASSPTVNGGAAVMCAAGTNASFSIANPSPGTLIRNTAYGAGTNYAAAYGYSTRAVGGGGSQAWSFSAGSSAANWGISNLYLSGTYIWPPANGLGLFLASPPVYGGATWFPYYNAVPFAGLSATYGATQFGSVPPVLIPIYGSQTVANYAVQYPWANYFDLVVAGAGAGGDAGGSFQGSYGGPSGNWNGVTLTKAQMGVSNITWTIGAGGAPGAGTSVGGGTGGTSSVTVPGWSTLSAAGGTGHGTSIATGNTSFLPGVSMPAYNFTNHYGGNDYFPGGGAGATASAYGGQPGGGGAGGNAQYLSNPNGGYGGPGIGYAFIYQ